MEIGERDQMNTGVLPGVCNSTAAGDVDSQELGL